MTEASAWTTLKSNLHQGLEGNVHIQRFEDKLTGGIPDTNVCWNGLDFWMEGKFLKVLPKRSATLIKVDLRANQTLWLETRKRAGGKVFVWVRVADYGWMLFSDRFRDLKEGIPLEEFLKLPSFINCRSLVRHLVCELTRGS